MKFATSEAYELFHKGSLALSRMEYNGFAVDQEYLTKAGQTVLEKIEENEQKLKKGPIWKRWKKLHGTETKLTARNQLMATLIDLDIVKDVNVTDKGNIKGDRGELERIDNPFVRDYLETEKLRKLHGTYIKGIEREVTNGKVHGFFNLHLVTSFRGSCVAKGTLIEVVRDVKRYPKGIPIEDVCVGDLVYCYDDNNELTVREVLNAGKTGHKKVIRLHWKGGAGKRGYVDVTPEHKIRLPDGSYVQAKEFAKDKSFRTRMQAHKSSPKSVAAMGRRQDMLYATGLVDGVYDHRVVYAACVGNLAEHEVVHHVDQNHLNNVPSNLRKMSRSCHSKLHADLGQGYNTAASRQKSLQRRMVNHRRFGDRWKAGKHHHLYKDITRLRLLRLLAKYKGRVVRLLQAERMDHATLTRALKQHSVDKSAIRKRYGTDGGYVSRGRLLKALQEGGFDGARKSLRIDYYSLQKHIKYRGINYSRKWANQHGSFTVNNHIITSVEYLHKPVDVYDLEVKDYHNFIANEICVHNSDNPNLQNVPVRDPYVSEIIRRAFIPRAKNRCIVEIDFSGIEVRISAVYNKDPKLISYLAGHGDMHRDAAADLYCCTQEQVSKMMRNMVKNQYVFPQFYGSFHKLCAPALWESIDRYKFEVDNIPMKKWLRAKGIKELGDCVFDASPRPGTFERHVAKAEDVLWNERFKVYRDWKRSWYDKYLRRGYLQYKTGFVVDCPLNRKEACNWPIQGTAFHCLLWSLVEIDRLVRKRKLDALLVSQIHDSIIADVHEDCVDDYIELAVNVMIVKLMKHWTWLNVPLEVEAEVSSPGCSWYEKKVYSL